MSPPPVAVATCRRCLSPPLRCHFACWPRPSPSPYLLGQGPLWRQHNQPPLSLYLIMSTFVYHLTNTSFPSPRCQKHRQRPPIPSPRCQKQCQRLAPIKLWFYDQGQTKAQIVWQTNAQIVSSHGQVQTQHQLSKTFASTKSTMTKWPRRIPTIIVTGHTLKEAQRMTLIQMTHLMEATRNPAGPRREDFQSTMTTQGPSRNWTMTRRS